MIYITTHKDFQVPEFVNDSNYMIITDGVELRSQYPTKIIEANNRLQPMKHCYSEGFQMYDIWMKDNTSEYIGINHYRRYFCMQRDNDNIRENVLPPKWNFNVYTQYGFCHNIDDLFKVKDIIDKYYEGYDTNNLNGLYTCNMFILEHEIFNKYCRFMFGVLDIFNEQNNLNTDKDVENYIIANKDKYSMWDFNYQSRLYGFLMERIGTIFFNKYFEDKPVKLDKYFITE